MSCKPIVDIKVGDWVLLESMFLSRHVSKPWEVTKISKTRVDVRRWRMDSITKEAAVDECKYVYLKTILFVFSNESEANAAFEFDRDSSNACEDAVRELRANCDKLFSSYMESLK